MKCGALFVLWACVLTCAAVVRLGGTLFAGMLAALAVGAVCIFIIERTPMEGE